LAAWWAELRCSSRSFGWEQPFRAARWPDRLEGVLGQRGIVLVHGYACNRALWQPWLPGLQAAGVPFIAPSLGPVLAPIECYVAQLDAAVRRITAATGQAPLLVCHSMGGLVARAWLRAAIAAEGPAALQRVHRVLTLGSPHHGTWLARWGDTASARQMCCDSDWLRVLAASESAELQARFCCVYSDCDNVVFPAGTARLDGARELLLPGYAHLQLLQAPELPALLRQLCAEAGEPAGATG
jgi:pimeloyl-ACP methyl ester carboxylesterase